MNTKPHENPNLDHVISYSEMQIWRHKAWYNWQRSDSETNCYMVFRKFWSGKKIRRSNMIMRKHPPSFFRQVNLGRMQWDKQWLPFNTLHTLNYWNLQTDTTSHNFKSLEIKNWIRLKSLTTTPVKFRKKIQSMRCFKSFLSNYRTPKAVIKRRRVWLQPFIT